MAKYAGGATGPVECTQPLSAQPLRVLITGASRGIGAAVARRFANENAHIALLARSSDRPAHSNLSGTLLEVAQDVEARGGSAWVFGMDMWDDPKLIRRQVHNAIGVLGGLDVLINNASALDVSCEPTAIKTSLVMDVNAKGTLSVCLECAPALRESVGSMVTLSPPIDLSRPDWIAAHPHYTISKYAMTMATLGFASDGIRANCVWPRHTIATAATKRLETMGALPHAYTKGRDPKTLANIVYALATQPHLSGHAMLDDEVADRLVDFGFTDTLVELILEDCDAPLDAFANAKK